MTSYFFDSSALVKLYTHELGTAWIIGLLKPSNNNTIFIARITSVEVVAGLARQMRLGHLTLSKLNKAIVQFEKSLQWRYAFVEVQETLAASARTLIQHYNLRGYDAVQLAAALQIHHRFSVTKNNSLIFVSADNELNTAARAEGLLVENPNNHP